MPGYQPRHDTDPVWFGDAQVNNLLVASQQTGVRITAIYGWDDRPDVRDVRELRSGQDGEYADNLYLGGRTVTVEGEVYGSSWADLQARKRALAALFQPSSTEALLKVPNPASFAGLTSWSASGMTGFERSSLRVVEAIQFGDTLDPACQVWQVVLRASDPRVYSDVETSTDSGTSGTAARTVTVDQTGTYEAPPTITVTGPTASTFAVTSSDLTVSFSGVTLAASETMTIDADQRTVVLGASYTRVRTSTGNVLALWPLTEAAGTTADNAQGTATYDGTYTGGFTLNQSGPASGVAAVELNGSTGYVTVAYNAAMNPNDFSFEGWFYYDALANTQIIETIDSNRGWGINTTPTGQLNVAMGNASLLYEESTVQSVPIATWTHFVFTASTTSDTGKLYLNGSLALEMSAPGFVAATSGALQFGRFGTSNYFDGKLSSFALYNAVLSPGQIADLYEASQATNSVNGYTYVDAQTSRWANLGTGSTVYTLSSSGLNTGSKLSVSYRDARL
jgi:hypothetical protein